MCEMDSQAYSIRIIKRFVPKFDANEWTFGRSRLCARVEATTHIYLFRVGSNHYVSTLSASESVDRCMHEAALLDPNQNSDISRVYFFSIWSKKASKQGDEKRNICTNGE